MAAKRLFKSLDPESTPPTDVKFLFKDEEEVESELRAHKLILGIASDVFDREFFGSMKEIKEVIDIVDASHDVFRVMIEYIYNKQFCWDDYDLGFLASLYYLADKYNIVDLRQEIIASVPRHTVSKGNVLEIGILAEANTHHQSLSDSLYRSAATFLTQTFKADLDNALNFFFEKKENMDHAVVIFKIMAAIKKMKPTIYQRMPIILTYLDPLKCPFKFEVEVSRSGSVDDMCAALGKLANIPDYNMMVTKVSNDKIDQILTGEYQLEKLGYHYSPRIYVYEMAKPDPTNVMVQVYSREKVNSKYVLFGKPFMCSVPKVCTASQLYEILLQRMSRYVSRPAQGEKWWIGPEDDTNADSDQGSVDSDQEEEDIWLISATMFSITLIKEVGNPIKGSSSIGKHRMETITLSMNSILCLDWDQTAKQKFFNESASKEIETAR